MQKLHQNKKIYKTVIYCRLSKEDGDKAESNSIIGQKAYCYDFVSKHDDLKIVRQPIVDDGVSGVSFDRTGFKELEKEITAGNVNCVVVRDLSRFSRNYIDAGRYIERIFPSLGVRFIAINDNYDSLKSDSHSDSFVLPFKNLINDSYSKDISIKVRSSLNTKKKNGEFVGAFAPYGYKRDNKNKNKLLIDEKAGEVVQLIFSSFKDGMSIKKIAEMLNNKGVLPPMDYKRANGFNFETVFKTSEKSKWEYNTVKRILVNDVYIGTLTQGKSGTPNYKVKIVKEKDKSEWFVTQDAHKPLVEKEDFFSVCELLKRDMRSTFDDSANALSGFLFCADCGSTMIRQNAYARGKKYVYYVCSNHKKNKMCFSHSISVNDVEEKVLTAIKNQIDLILEYKKVSELTLQAKYNNGKMFSFERQVEELNEEITKYQNLKLRLNEDLYENIISKEEYLEFKGIYKSIIDDKKIAINNLDKIGLQTIYNGDNNKNWVSTFKENKNIDVLSRRVLMALVYKVKIYEKRTLEIIFKYSDTYENLNTVEIA